MPKKLTKVQIALSSTTYKTLLKIAELRQVSPVFVASELLAEKVRMQQKLLKAFGQSAKSFRERKKQ